MKKLIILFFALIVAHCAWAYSFTVGGIYYNITSGSTVEVTYGGTTYTGSITIPSAVVYSAVSYNVTSIGVQTFLNCSGLTSVTIPSSVTSIGYDAFDGCSGLTSVSISGSVTSIGDRAFWNCSGLTSVTIPSSITSIGVQTFYGCSGLISVTIPNSVTSIGGQAFYGCSGLTSITIPSSVTSIGDRAFYGTEWYNNRPNGLIYINNIAYKYKGTMPANTSITLNTGTTRIAASAFLGCSGLTSITIPSSVSTIGDWAFWTCAGLTSVTIPSSVTSIGSEVFYGCWGLTSIYANSATPVNLASSNTVFNGVNTSSCVLHVPVGSISAYRAANQWGAFANIVDDTPILTTTVASNITNATAQTGGNITSAGTSSVTTRGVCWSTTSNPTTADNKTTDGSGTGVFTSSITGLSPAQTYHTRAYATNSVGTSYGSDLTFTTLGTAPTITTTTPSNITTTTATAGGNVTDAGTSTVTVRGVCWSTTINPTIANSKTADANGVGTFSSSITGLTSGVTYHIRAYATSSVGTSYGSDIIFITLGTAPTVTTTTASNITNATAQAGGNVTSSGTSTVTARGVCWSTTANPTIANSKTTDDSGIGVFTSIINSLTPATTYHIRAYATSSDGTSYGSDLTFTTLGTAPTITTTTASNITTTTATAGGNVTDVGTSTVTARGVCWSTSTNPTVANSKTTDGTGIGTFTSSVTGLIPNTTYHIRAYATSSVGTSYGSDLTLTTICLAPSSFSLSAPANGGWTTSTPLFQWATAIGASTYNLYIDGVLKKANITTTNYQILSNEAITSGMHTWYIVASNGCSTESNETWSFRVDTAQPTAFSLVSPTDNSWTASLQPTFSWGASSDVNSGLAKYQLWIDGTLNRDNIVTTATSTTPTLNLTNGSHTWEIRAVDNVGIVRNSTQIWTVKIDNLPPGNSTGSCLYFDGTAHTFVSMSSALHITNYFTIETWIKFQSGGSGLPKIISKKPDDVGYSGEYELYLTSRGATSNLAFGVDGIMSLTSNQLLNENTWYHIATTFTKNGSIITMCIYINGVLDKTNSQSFSSITLPNTTQNLVLGRMGIGTQYTSGYKGWIDEVKIWNSTRTQDQILIDKDAIITAAETNLAGYWRLNEDVGSVAKDISLNHYDGAIVGASYTNSPLSASYNACNLKMPILNQYLSSNLPTFSWGSAPDTGIGFQKFQLFIDGNIVKDNLSDSTWTVTSPLAYGAHTWNVKGFDLLGNNQASISKSFFIDNARPNAFNLTSPINNQIVNLPTPNLTWQAPIDSTGGSGLRKYQLWVNGVVSRDSIPITQTTVAPKNALAQGVYTWFIKAYDNVGNVRQSTQTNTLYVDWENPTDFTLITPLGNSTLTVAKPEFKWHKSTDVGSGISKYELNITGQTPITILPSDTSKTITSNLPNGPYTWYVKAYDVAGGFTSSTTQTFTISATVSEVEQTEMNSSIKVYPNPVGNELVIESAKNGRTNFEILNSMGQLVYKGILLDKTVVQTSSFNSGIYIVKLENGKTYEFKKILKE